MDDERYKPKLCDEMLSQLSASDLKKYIADKSLDIKGHKERGREEDANTAQRFLDQAAAVLALKVTGVKVA
jgi:hypothetical protein